MDALHEAIPSDNTDVAVRLSLGEQKTRLPPIVETSEDFDWSDDDAVVIREQPETAIYYNQRGGLVIRQRNWPDDDVYVYFNAEVIDVFIDKLTDIVGIPSVGRRI